MAGSKTQKGSMQAGRTWKFHTEKPQLVSGFEPSCCKARVLTSPPLTFYLKFDPLGASVAYNSKCDQTWQGTVVFSVICLFNYDVMGWCFFFLYRYWHTAFLTYLHVSQFVLVLPVYVLCGKHCKSFLPLLIRLPDCPSSHCRQAFQLFLPFNILFYPSTCMSLWVGSLSASVLNSPLHT